MAICQRKALSQYSVLNTEDSISPEEQQKNIFYHFYHTKLIEIVSRKVRNIGWESPH